MVDFARKNPGIVVYVQPKRHRRPKVLAEYRMYKYYNFYLRDLIIFYLVNGSSHSFDVHQYSREQIQKWLDFHRTRSGVEIQRLLKPQLTTSPSIQGLWNPFTNKATELAVKTYPSKEFINPADSKKTATDKIMELYQAHKAGQQ